MAETERAETEPVVADDGIYGTERTLHDHGKALLDLLDKIAPKENADD